MLATAHGLLGPVHQHRVPAGAERGLEVGPPRRGRPTIRSTSAVTASATSSDQVTSQASPSGPCSAWTTRSMAASSAGVPGPAITTTSEGPANADATPDHPGHLALRLGHVPVARTDDHVDRLDGLGAVGHGGDGLGPAHPVDLVDAGHRRRGQRGVVDPAVGPGGTHSTISSTPATWAGTAHIEHGRRVAGPSPGGVAAGPGHRPDQVADLDAAGLEVGGLGVGRLVGVVGQDAVVGHVERLLERTGIRRQRGLDLRLGHPELVERRRRRTARVSRRRAASPSARTSAMMAATASDDRSCSSVGARQCVPQGPAATGEAAEVQAAESHSQSMLPDPWLPIPRPGRSRPSATGPLVADRFARCHDRSDGHQLRRTLLARHRPRRAESPDHRPRRRRRRRKDEETARELFAIERALNSANRRLARLSLTLSRR